MAQSVWEEKIKPIQKLIAKPILFNNLSITLFDALEALHEKDWYVDTHRHPWFEFNYVSEGAVYTTLEDQEFLVTAGQFYIIPPGKLHSHRHCNNQGDDGFCLRWQLTEISPCKENENFTSCAAEMINVLSVARPSYMHGNIADFIQSTNENRSIVGLEAAFVTWLVGIYELWREKDLQEIYENHPEKILVQQVLLYLSEYYAHNLTVQEIATSLHISYRHLARIFKQVTGSTLIERLNDMRVNEAKKLLKTTNKTIGDIARTVGFANEFYFSTIFKQYAYSSPTAFRKRCNK